MHRPCTFAILLFACCATAFGQAELVRDAYRRRSACDPLLARAWIHLADAELWLGESEHAALTARERLSTFNQQRLAPTYILALATSGGKDRALHFVNTEISSEQERLKTKSMLAAMSGEAAAAKNWLDQYTAITGPDDLFSLVMNAQQGNHNEANRLAGLIDQRPFGYMVLMQAIYYCLCGAPFDLDAAPTYSSMLKESGLPWPPVKPIDFPLKGW